MIQAEELVHGLDREGFLFEGLVGLDQLQEGLLLVRLQDFLDLVDAQAFHLGALLGVHPGGVGGELRDDLGPLGFGEGFLAFLQHEGAHGFDGRFPGGIHGVQRKKTVGGGLGKGFLADLGGLGEVALDGADLLHGDTHGRGGIGIETDELAAHEVVRDLVFQGLDGGEGVGGLVPEREDVLGAGVLPGGVVGERGVESFDVVRGDAVGPAAVRRLADDLGDAGDEGGERFVIRGGRGDDPVAVELGLGEDLHVVGRVLECDGLFLELEVLQDLLGGSQELGPVGRLLVEGGEGEFGAALKQDVRVLENAGEPLGSGDDFVHADVSILVGVNQFQRLLVEFQVLRRAAEHGPHFTVQFSEVGDVGPGTDFHADGSADRCEGPDVRDVCHIGRV